MKGPVWNEEYPRGHYELRDEQVRFVIGAIKVPPQFGKTVPSWEKVVEYAGKLDSDLHASGDAFQYVLIEKQTLLVLKVDNIARGSEGYLAVYRAEDGSFSFTSNGEDRPWKPLPKGKITDVLWDDGDHMRIHIDVVRPNLDEDNLDREVDYRFQIEDLAKKP